MADPGSSAVEEASPRRGLCQLDRGIPYKGLGRAAKLSYHHADREYNDESEDGVDDESLESDWGGLSEDEDAVEVVEHSVPNVEAEDGVDFGKKAFMENRKGVKKRTTLSKLYKMQLDNFSTQTPT